MLDYITYNFKTLYKNNLGCNTCKSSECTQQHLLYCPKPLGTKEALSYRPSYGDISNDNEPSEQIYIATIMMENYERKIKIIITDEYVH